MSPRRQRECNSSLREEIKKRRYKQGIRTFQTLGRKRYLRREANAMDVVRLKFNSRVEMKA